MLKGLGTVAFCLVGAIVYTKKPWLSVESKKTFGPAVDALVIELNKDVDEFGKLRDTNDKLIEYKETSPTDSQKTLENKYRTKATNFDSNLVPQVKKLRHEIGKELLDYKKKDHLATAELLKVQFENMYKRNSGDFKKVKNDVDGQLDGFIRANVNSQKEYLDDKVGIKDGVELLALQYERPLLLKLKKEFSNTAYLESLQHQQVNQDNFNKLAQKYQNMKHKVNLIDLKLHLLSCLCKEDKEYFVLSGDEA